MPLTFEPILLRRGASVLEVHQTFVSSKPCWVGLLDGEPRVAARSSGEALRRLVRLTRSDTWTVRSKTCH